MTVFRVVKKEPELQTLTPAEVKHQFQIVAAISQNSRVYVLQKVEEMLYQWVPMTPMGLGASSDVHGYTLPEIAIREAMRTGYEVLAFTSAEEFFQKAAEITKGAPK